MSSFYGAQKRHSYFEGWYLKHQNSESTVALIPAFHVDEAGRRSASLQVITGEGSYNACFPIRKFHACQNRFSLRLGESAFSEHGCRLSLQTNSLRVEGALRYGAFTPPAGDIMGPFRFVPFMQCRHSVFSLSHTVSGRLSVNGKQYQFQNDIGYMEGDRGSSFPNRYLWTQCGWRGNCVMLSVADIPFGGTSFTGCIGVIYFGGREYRIATYCGVKLLHLGEKAVLLRQGELSLLVELLESSARPLRAPQLGGMTRTVHESAACLAHYRFKIGNQTQFDFTSDKASFESDWNKPFLKGRPYL